MRQIKYLVLILSFFIINSLYSSDKELILDKIEFIGLSTLTNTEAQKALNLPPKQVFQPELVDAVKSRILSVLSDKGFFFATVDRIEIVPTGTGKVNLVVYINENVSTDKVHLRIIGNRYFSEDKIMQLLNIKNPQTVKLRNIPDIEKSILRLYTDREYLFASVKLDSLQLADNVITAIVRIDEGPLFRMQKLKITGNKVTKDNTIVRISGISYIKQFTPDALTQSEDNLLRKAYIKDCRVTPLDASTLGIYIEEAKMTLIQGVLGISNNPQTKKNEFSGILKFDFLNLWGTDRALSLNWKKMKTSYQSLELKYHESGWENYPYSGDLAFQRIEQDSAWISLKAELSLYYNSLYYKLGAYTNSETIYPTTKDSTIVVKSSYNRFGLLYDYSNIDYTSNPTQGNRFQARTGWMFSKTQSTSNKAPTYELDYANYYLLRPKLVNAINFHYREITDSNAKSYEQYKMGGFSSIRGFDEDVFSSHRLGWINWEMRYLLDKDSRIFLLMDYGLYQQPDNSLKADIFGGGLGFALKTKLGVMGISYALGYIDNHLKEFNAGMLHIGIESSF